MNDKYDGELFRIERILGSKWRMKVTTKKRRDAAYFFLNTNWALRLDEDDIEQLQNYTSNPDAFMEKLEPYLDTHMKLTELKADR